MLRDRPVPAQLALRTGVCSLRPAARSGGSVWCSTWSRRAALSRCPSGKKLQDRSDTASGVPLHQKHMASSRLLTYPQGTARNRELLGKLRKPTSDTEQLQIDTMRDTGDSYTSYKHANKNSL